MQDFIELIPKKKSKKCNKLVNGKSDHIPFFTEDDYEPGKLKVNIHKDFTLERPKPEKKKKFQGATFEAGGGGFSLRIFFG